MTFKNTPSHLLNRFAFLFFTCIVLVGFSACSSSSTDSGDDDDDMMMREPTFSNVQAIFNGNCGGSGCHIGERESGVRLDGFSNVINSVGDQYGTEIVQPGNAANSPIIDKISNSSPQFGSRMPLNRSPLSSDDINLIRDWINAGAQNN